MLEHYLKEIERRTSYLSYVEREEIRLLIDKVRKELEEKE